MKAKTMKLESILTILLFFLPLFFLPPAIAQTVEKRIEIRCDFPGQKIEAGDTATFELPLVNHGETATYNL
ncbi:MAG: hypothetical protein WAV32_04245, partial [Halobacteriota archaeon]